MRTTIKILLLTVTSFLFAVTMAIAQTCGTSQVTYSGYTSSYLPKWNVTSGCISNSSIFDNGNVGIGTAAPGKKFDVNGDALIGASNRAAGHAFLFLDAGTAAGNEPHFRFSQNTILKAQIKWSSDAAGGIDFYTVGTGSFVRFTNAGNVGIGITSPLAKLHLNNGSVLFDGTTGATPTSGAGTRMMWIPAKGAFRAGTALSSEWNDASIGTNSTAFGSGTTASGSYSSAFGGGTIASGYLSSAFGNGSVASGQNSTALGSSTTASGVGSVAAGSGSVASGVLSNVFGISLTAQSYASFVIGRYNTISGTTGSWVATDPLFVIGNGASAGAASNALTVLKNGKTLIGNPTLAGFMGTPDGYLLFVQQGILAEKVKVAVATTAYWSDYVFDEKYKLKSIEDLESFVKTNKHLPNIPSAEEVVKDGIDMATIDAKLLEKIEELSLYIIQQNKRIEALEKKALYKK
ncbi:MAG: hypothetical protein Q7W13_11360 [Bacteroidia bacterium]|nr:hypothetical protein [Bacteroidia bacterium]